MCAIFLDKTIFVQIGVFSVIISIYMTYLETIIDT